MAELFHCVTLSREAAVNLTRRSKKTELVGPPTIMKKKEKDVNSTHISIKAEAGFTEREYDHQMQAKFDL